MAARRRATRGAPSGNACRAEETFGDARAVFCGRQPPTLWWWTFPATRPWRAGPSACARRVRHPGKARHAQGIARAFALAREPTLRLAAPGSTATLRNLRRDTYFRLLADGEADGADIATPLIERGLAKPYAGSRKEW